MNATINLVHYTSPQAAENIRRVGFQDQYRNPNLFGFSFAPKGETFAKSRGTVPINVIFRGNFIDPSGPEDRPIDVYSGNSANEQWNQLVRSIANRVGLDWDTQNTNDEWWRRREQFATALRRELLNRGIDAVQAGGEIIVVNPTKLQIQEKGFIQRILGRDRTRQYPIHFSELPKSALKQMSVRQRSYIDEFKFYKTNGNIEAWYAGELLAIFLKKRGRWVQP